MSDVDMGHWQYAYDRHGNLTQQTDACDNRTDLSYDTLGRLTSKQLTQGANPACNTATPTASSITYSYDENHSAGNPSRGQLTRVARGNEYDKRLTYNERGLLDSERVDIAGIPDDATTQYFYDEYLRPTTIIYPDGENVTTAYNSLGLPILLTSTLGMTTTTLVDAVNYDESGRLTQLRFPAGDNLVRTQVYAPWNQQDSNGGLLTAILVGAGPGVGDKLSLVYTYDSFGNFRRSPTRA
jgi:YD repeat-containing protein